MKILAISDVHGLVNKLGHLLEKEIDIEVLVFSGDIAPYGSPYKTYEHLLRAIDIAKMYNVRLFVAVPGNMDMADHYNIVRDPIFVNIHNNYKIYGNLVFLGFGGSTISPFNTLFEFEDEFIEKNLSKLYNMVSAAISPSSYIQVLITHTPPYKTKCDLAYSGENIGSKAVRKFIEDVANPSLAICGHVHESRCIDKLKDTIIVNPGPLYKGFYAVIEITNNEVKAYQRKLS